MAAAGQKDRGVPPPPRGALDPPPHDLTELPRPRLKRPVPETRKCSEQTIPPRGSSTVAVSVRLCGSTPTTLPARSDVINVLDGPGPRLILLPMTTSSARALRATVMEDPVDNVPVGIDVKDHVGKRSYQVRPAPESTDRGRHF